MSATVQPAPIATRLNTEWESRYAHREYLFGALGIRSCDDLITEIRAGVRRDSSTAQRERTDVVLYELLTLARSGNRIAERVLVQVLLPAAQRMAHRVRALDGMDRADRVGYAITCAWEVIGVDYKMHLHQRVHANLTMGLLGKLSERTPTDKAIHDQTTAVSNEFLEAELDAWTGAEPPVEVLALRLFAWAVDTGALTREETALLARVTMGDDEETREQIAESLGITIDNLHKRVQRIRKRLKAAYTEAF